MANQNKPITNPATGGTQLISAIDRGIEIRHEIYFNILVKTGFTRIQPNAIVNLGVTITVEPGAEIIIL